MTPASSDNHMWSVWFAAGHPTPLGLVADVDPDVAPDPDAAGVDVTAAQIRAASPATAALWAQRAADPAVALAAARDHRRSVQVAAIDNPRCPVAAIRDVALGASPPPKLSRRAAQRLDTEALAGIVRARGPVVICPGGWAVTFSSDQLLAVMASARPAQNASLAALLVWPSVARWVTTAEPAGFDAAAVITAAMSAVMVPDDPAPATLCGSALALELHHLRILDAGTAQRLSTVLELSGIGVLPPVRAVPTTQACAAMVEASPLLFELAFSRPQLLDAATFARAVERGAADPRLFAVVRGALAKDPALWPVLSDSTKRLVAELVAADRTVDPAVAMAALSDAAVPRPIAATLLARLDTSPTLVPTELQEQAWLELGSLWDRLEGFDVVFGASRVLRIAELCPVLAEKHPGVIWAAADQVLAGPHDDADLLSSRTLTAVLTATAPIPADRLTRWLVGARMPGLIEPTAAGVFGSTLSPHAAVEVLRSVRAAPGVELDVAAAFADQIAADPVGLAALCTITGLPARLAAASNTHPQALGPIAARLTDRGLAASATAWRLVAELAPTWPGTLDELIDSATLAMSQRQPAVA